MSSQPKHLLLIALAILAVGCANASELRLANGDVLKGDVLSQDGGKIRFRSPVLGTIEVDKALAKIVDVVDRAVESSDSTRHATQAAAPSAQELHASSKHTLTTAWRSKLDLGLNWQDGRKDQQDVSVRLESERAIRKNDYRVQARFLYSEVNDVKTAQHSDADLRWRREFSNRWFSQSDTSYFNDDLKEIDLNIDQNVGVGYKVLTGRRAVANVGAGLTLQYRDAANVSGEISPFGQFFQDLKWRFNDRVELSQEAGALYSPDGRSFQIDGSAVNEIADHPSYKLTFQSVLRGQVTESVNVNVRYEYQFDNSILNRDARTDQRVTTSLGYMF